jgi:hypothetical protein
MGQRYPCVDASSSFLCVFLCYLIEDDEFHYVIGEGKKKRTKVL